MNSDIDWSNSAHPTDEKTFVTRAIHQGQHPQSTAVPIFQGVNAPTQLGETDYVSNSGMAGGPTIDALESLVAELEGANWSVAVPSGMAAISLVYLALLSQGERIVAHRCIYTFATRFLNEELVQKMGVEVVWVDMRDLDAVRGALKQPTRLVYFEPIANPSMHLLDVAAIATLAKEAGAVVAVDNTLLSPYLLRPLTHNVDIVLHSATKYLGGHGDAMAGVISGNSPELQAEIAKMRMLLGSFLAPLNAYLVMRGIRTLPFRMEQHCRNAEQVARFLNEHPQVTAVRYPGLPNHPASSTAKAQVEAYGALLGFTIDPAIEPEAFRQRLKLCRPWGSLGDVETLVAAPAASDMRDIPPNYVRIAVGLESVEDIVADLSQALGS